MPRVEPAEYEALPLEAHRIAREFAPIHDVWRSELEGGRPRTVAELRSALTAGHIRELPLAVRGLFGLRSALGRIFNLDATSSGAADRKRLVAQLPSHVARASSVPPGTADGAFELLYMLPDEAAYQVHNATVHAIVVVALSRADPDQRFYWATYVRSVGRITSLYMGLIDPFRRWIVYPGLESWLKRSWRSLDGER